MSHPAQLSGVPAMQRTRYIVPSMVVVLLLAYPFPFPFSISPTVPPRTHRPNIVIDIINSVAYKFPSPLALLVVQHTGWGLEI